MFDSVVPVRDVTGTKRIRTFDKAPNADTDCKNVHVSDQREALEGSWGTNQKFVVSAKPVYIAIEPGRDMWNRQKSKILKQHTKFVHTAIGPGKDMWDRKFQKSLENTIPASFGTTATDENKNFSTKYKFENGAIRNI